MFCQNSATGDRFFGAETDASGRRSIGGRPSLARSLLTCWSPPAGRLASTNSSDLRQHPQNERDRQQGHRPAHQKDISPGGHVQTRERTQQVDGQDAAETGADAVAQVHDAQRKVAPPPVGELGHDRIQAGEHAADADAGQEPQNEQICGIAGEEGCHHAERNYGDTEENLLAPTHDVGQGGNEEGAKGHPQRSGAVDKALHRLVEPHLRSDACAGKRDRQDVEAIEHVDEAAQRHHRYLEQGHRPLVDNGQEFGSRHVRVLPMQVEGA